MFRKLSIILMPLVLLIFFVPIQQVMAMPAKSYYADQFNVAMAVQNDGTLLVAETVTFHFVGGPFTYVYRDIPTDKTGGITVTSASMDGRSMQAGSNAGQYEVATSNPIRVTWHFAPTSNATHIFVITYHVAGVIQKTANTDFLDWEALPTSYSYTIRAVKIDVTYPERAQVIGNPEVVNGHASLVNPSTKDLVTYEAKNLNANDTLEIGIHFRAGSLIQIAPDWQLTQEQADMYLFPCILGGILLGLLLALGIFFYKRKYQPKEVVSKVENVTAPPDDLSPAVSGVLVTSSTQGVVNLDQALGTLFDLANRGILTIVESTQGTANSYQQAVFMLELRNLPPEDLRSYEIGLLHILFNGADHPASVSFADVLARYASQPLHFDAPVQQELLQRGFLNERYEPLRARLNKIMLGLSVIGLLGSLLGFFVGRILYIWPLGFVPLGLLLTAIITIFIRASCSLLSFKGKQEVEIWQAFDRYLRSIVWGSHQEENNQAIFISGLPYAISFGLGASWVQYFQNQGMTTLPSWFLSVANTDQRQQAPNPATMTSMLTMLAITHPATYSNINSSSGFTGFAGGGGFGGGAAGGGSSGAG